MELIAAAYTATSYLNEHEEQATDYEREAQQKQVQRHYIVIKIERSDDIFLKKFLLYFALLDV